MKIATILPLQYQYLEQGNDYHMALAHLVLKNTPYSKFFLDKSRRGDHVIMDNGVVEGDQRPFIDLVQAAYSIRATEVVLPDVIGDMSATLRLGEQTLNTRAELEFDWMAVPQGRNASEWSACLHEMLSWPVLSIGFSKFMILNGTFTYRVQALRAYGQQIRDTGKYIHLLGLPLGPTEPAIVESRFPGMVRGLDSAYPAFCAAGDVSLSVDGSRPEAELNFLDGRNIKDDRMLANYLHWKLYCGSAI